jgi:protein-S-isoprenylcysteine O-methyltransferase Ste14
MYEHRNHPPLTRGAFFLRMLRHFLIALAFVGVSLGAGIIVYSHFEQKTPRDAFLNAAMLLLGGTGPVHTPQTDEGKIFAGLYALYAGLVFLVVAALLLTPIFHRLLQTFHWDESAQNVRPHRAAPSDKSPAD